LKYTDPTGADFTRDILKTQIPFEFIDPRHELQNIWDAPFFFADRRHVFLVTTEEQPGWIRDYGGYGILDNPIVVTMPTIPPLVVQPAPPTRPRLWGGGGPIGSDAGVIAPALMQRFVTEDAYIRQGLGTTVNVKYGDGLIGPSGAITDSGAAR
jgi:hypothetical protein